MLQRSANVTHVFIAVESTTNLVQPRNPTYMGKSGAGATWAVYKPSNPISTAPASSQASATWWNILHAALHKVRSKKSQYRWFLLVPHSASGLGVLFFFFFLFFFGQLSLLFLRRKKYILNWDPMRNHGKYIGLCIKRIAAVLESATENLRPAQPVVGEREEIK